MRLADTHRLAVERARARSGPASAALPAHLNCDWWLRLRVLGLCFCLASFATLWAVLGGATVSRPKVDRIDAAGEVIRELPVERIDNIVVDKTRSGSDVIADYTVRLPAVNGGEDVSATFRTLTKDRIEPGEKIHVLYAPSAPELGAVGDDWREELEIMLEGRAFDVVGQRSVLLLWGVLAGLGLAAPFLLQARPARRRRMDGSGIVFRAVIAGTTEYTLPPAKDSERRSEEEETSGSRTECLVLRTSAGDIPFSISASLEGIMAAVKFPQGWVHWEPARRKNLIGKALPMVKADFVSDEGWQLRGEVPVGEADRAAAVHEDTAVADATRKVRSLEPSEAWVLALGRPTVWIMLFTLLCMTLLMLPADGAWRVLVAIAGGLSMPTALITQIVLWVREGKASDRPS